MINAEIQLYIPDFSKFTFKNAYDKASKHMEGSIKRNFAEGGRPRTWALKKDGTPSYLFKTGKLFGSIVSGFSGNGGWAGIENTASVPYAFAQNFGYAPRNLVAREFILFQKEDEEEITAMFENEIVTFWQTQKKEI